MGNSDSGALWFPPIRLPAKHRATAYVLSDTMGKVSDALTDCGLAEVERSVISCGTGFALGVRAFPFVMSDLFSMLPAWFYVLLAVGVWDALLQWSEYREWRKEQGEPEEFND